MPRTSGNSAARCYTESRMNLTLVGEPTAHRGHRPRKIHPASEGSKEAIRRKELAENEGHHDDPNAQRHIRSAEARWQEAHGVGRKEWKIKRFLD